MLTVEQLPKTWEEYQRAFDERCTIQNGDDIVPREEVYEQSEKVLGKWPGFRDYMRNFTQDTLYGDYVWEEINKLLAQSNRETWENIVFDTMAKHLGWAAVQINYMLAYLEYLRQKEGWGKTLERIARLEGHYDGLIVYFNQLEKNPVLEFDAQHPALFDFTQFYFYILVTEVLKDEQRYQAFLEVLERGDDIERRERLIEVWLAPSETILQGGMYTLVGFLSQFEYHRLWK